MLAKAKSIHERLTFQLMEYISLGIYLPGEKLPSVRELSNQYHVNPNTVVKVYNGLEDEGYVYAVPAKGYYVAKPDANRHIKLQKQIEALIHLVCTLSRLAGISPAELQEIMKKQMVKEEKANDGSKGTDQENRSENNIG